MTAVVYDPLSRENDTVLILASAQLNDSDHQHVLKSALGKLLRALRRHYQADQIISSGLPYIPTPVQALNFLRAPVRERKREKERERERESPFPAAPVAERDRAHGRAHLKYDSDRRGCGCRTPVARSGSSSLQQPVPV